MIWYIFFSYDDFVFESERLSDYYEKMDNEIFLLCFEHQLPDTVILKLIN